MKQWCHNINQKDESRGGILIANYMAAYLNNVEKVVFISPGAICSITLKWAK